MASYSQGRRAEHGIVHCCGPETVVSQPDTGKRLVAQSLAILWFAILPHTACSQITRAYDVRMEATSPTCRLQWTLAGRKMSLSHNRKGSEKSERDTTDTWEVTLDDQTALRLRRLFDLGPILSLSRTYINTCAPGAQQGKLRIETLRRTQTILVRGFLPAPIDILWKRIVGYLPPKAQAINRNALRRCLVPRWKTDTTSRPIGFSPDTCVTEEVGLVHDTVDEFKIGKPAVISALAPKGWRLTLHVQTEVTRYYRDIAMTCRGCACSAQVPQDILMEGTLYYYITARDHKGRQVDGAASKSSPNVVEVKSCLKFD